MGELPGGFSKSFERLVGLAGGLDGTVMKLIVFLVRTPLKLRLSRPGLRGAHRVQWGVVGGPKSFDALGSTVRPEDPELACYFSMTNS